MKPLVSPDSVPYLLPARDYTIGGIQCPPALKSGSEAPDVRAGGFGRRAATAENGNVESASASLAQHHAKRCHPQFQLMRTSPSVCGRS